MKGEKELIEKILQTEINIFRSIRDGSALMQHMEDFYYISLLEVCSFIWIIIGFICNSFLVIFTVTKAIKAKLISAVGKLLIH